MLVLVPRASCLTCLLGYYPSAVDAHICQLEALAQLPVWYQSPAATQPSRLSRSCCAASASSAGLRRWQHLPSGLAALPFLCFLGRLRHFSELVTAPW